MPGGELKVRWDVIVQSHTPCVQSMVLTHSTTTRCAHAILSQVVYWVNSGSEANDLALRIARAHTGKRGVITVGARPASRRPHPDDAHQGRTHHHAPPLGSRPPPPRPRRPPLRAGGAYHGHTQTVIDISPYKYARAGGTGRRSWVREAPLPDVFSGAHRAAGVDDAAAGAAYAADVAALVDAFAADEAREAARRGVAAHGHPAAHAGAANGGSAPPAAAAATAAGDDDDGLTAGVGAFIMESLLSCGGQVLPPAGYLTRVYAAVRAAGGVCIADEVQVGFGRVGAAFWGFELHGVVPDIVTIGKPMGNGFPVAAVITTPALAASFANGMEYFNTYGGNPVAGAVANAVLDVVLAEGLQAHAAAVGAALLAGFRRLYDRFAFVGSVRGVGLMVGLEVLRPLTPAQRADVHCADRTPWPAGASAIVYALRARRVLLSVDGMDNNVIKLKPPMVFTLADAARVCAELEAEMATLAAAVEAGTAPGLA